MLRYTFYMLIGALLVAGCGPTKMVDKVGIVTVDGKEIEVRRNRAEPEIWEAYHVVPEKIRGDPRAQSRNIRAIEKVSGCDADLKSVVNYADFSATVVSLNC